MDIEKKLEILKTFELFGQLEEKDLKHIAQVVQQKTFAPKFILMEQEEDADFAYFIYKGGVRVYRTTEEGEEITLNILGPGEVVGELGLIDTSTRSATVETIQETSTLVVSGGDFKALLSKNPTITFHLLLILSARIRKLSSSMEDVMSKKLDERTWNALELLSKYFPNKEILLSQEELAQIIGATRARITEVLNKFADEGKLEIFHKKIQIF